MRSTLFSTSAAILLLFGALLACKQSEPIKASVNCSAVGPKLGNGFMCQIKHEQGEGDANVCWSLDVGCANGTKGSAKSCHNVETGAQVAAAVGYPTFNGVLDKCDNVSSLAVTDVTVTPLKQ